MTRATPPRGPRSRWLRALGVVLLTGIAPAQERLFPWGDPVRIERATPAPRSLGAPVDTTISITFDKPVRPESLHSRHAFWAYGRWSGAGRGRLVYSADRRTVTLVPAKPFSAGELVTVYLWQEGRGADGAPFQPGGASFQFWTAARPTVLDLRRATILDVQAGSGTATRAYGGFAADLDEDGRLDLGIVNELTADLRVWLNTGTGPEPYAAMETPPTPLGDRASPSEPCDFDADGHTDVVVLNTLSNTASILLGRGDGTFWPQQQVPVGENPRGLAVLDVDGDGDADVALTDPVAGVVSILENDGDGGFSAPRDLPVAAAGPWALAAADMDEDWRLDLVVGAQQAQQVLVLRNQGDGTFSHVSTQASGGLTWQLGCGDVNGDGHEDVALANGLSDHGAILLGDGAGGLRPPTAYPTDGWCTATDLGDLDGDGDLDWNLSAFFGDFTLYRNQGDGTYALAGKLPTFQSASCSVMYDVEGDGDLDLALIDETADKVIVMTNRDTTPVPCDLVRALVGSCAGGVLELAVVMDDASQNGRMVRVDVGGASYPVTVVGSQAVLTLPAPAATTVTVTLLEPAGCEPPLQVICP